MPLTASLVAGLIGDAGKIGFGIADKIKAKKLKDAAGDLTYDIQNEYYGNKSLLADQAQSGFSSASKNYFSNQADRGFAHGTDTVLQAGGNINAVQNLYDEYLQANNRFAAQDSEMQSARIDKLIEANYKLAGQKTQKWAIEKYEPWKNAMLGSAQANQSGTQNIFSGVSGAAGRLASYSMADDYKDLLDPKPQTMGQKMNNPVLPAAGMITGKGIQSTTGGFDYQSAPDFGPLINNQGPLTPAQIKAYKDAHGMYPDSPYLKGFVLPMENVA